MRDTILQVLQEHFIYNETKLGRIADDIANEISKKFCVRNYPKRYCADCMYHHNLITYGNSKDLCQRGHKKGLWVADICEDYYNVKESFERWKRKNEM